MTSDQIVTAMYWVRELYLGLMKRSKVRVDQISNNSPEKAENNDKNEKGEDDEEIEEEVQEATQFVVSSETLKFLEALDKYLHLHATLCYGGVSFAEVFMLLMLYKGELTVTTPE